MPAVAQYDLQVCQQGLGNIRTIGFRRVHGHFAETDDHVERRAQFVAYIGHKLLFGATRLFRFPAQVMRQTVQLGQLVVSFCQIIQCLPELKLIISTFFQGFAAPHMTGFEPLAGQEQRA